MSLTEQLERKHVSELEPHELNKEIYTNQDVSDLLEKIEAHGFKDEHRLLITTDDKILSGHRRWKAAKELGISEVPVEVVDTDGEQDELLRLLLANQYRDKTPAEKINEADAWERIEKEKAKDRKEEATGHTQKFAEGETGEAKEKAAERVGASKTTVRKGQKVKEKAESGDEKAKEEWEKMEKGQQSVHGAYSELKKSEQEKKALEQPYEWINTEPKDIQIQAKRDGKKIVACIDGEDYKMKVSTFSAIFKKVP